jgi:hypothetical protein
MVSLAKAIPLDEPANEGKCRLLEFLVAQMTYKIVVHGWEGSGFRGNQLLKRLFATSPTVVIWHLEKLHGMLEEVGFTGAVVALAEANVAGGAGGAGGAKRVKSEDEMSGGTGGVGAGLDVKPKVKRPSIGLPTNPATEQGCCFHEHKGKHSSCKVAVTIE